VIEPTFPRVQVLPGVDRASFRVDGAERVVYEFGLGQKRPFLFPVLGPSGAPLTRMGHPNPVGHEHHKSVWFGHQKVSGVNFWEERAGNDVRVRHRRVTVYHDGSDWGGLAAELDWWANGRSLLHHTLIVALQPLEVGDYALDLQSRFEVRDAPVELGRTNFGFLGVRVAKTVSEQFGAGTLRNDRGLEGEAALFGGSSRWVDYSGPTRPGQVEGICYMDHPDNPHHPTPWHVRRDGWMEAAFNLREGFGVARDHPLDLRYRLLVHAGRPSTDALQKMWEAFSATPAYGVVPARGTALPALVRDVAG
jgi:hypothetical protein